MEFADFEMLVWQRLHEGLRVGRTAIYVSEDEGARTWVVNVGCGRGDFKATVSPHPTETTASRLIDDLLAKIHATQEPKAN